MKFQKMPRALNLNTILTYGRAIKLHLLESDNLRAEKSALYFFVRSKPCLKNFLLVSLLNVVAQGGLRRPSW